MKTKFLTLVMMYLFVSCQNKSNIESVSTSSPSGDSTSNTLSEVKTISISLDSLKNFNGKKLMQDGLFEKFGIMTRIEKLMGKDFVDFKTGWGEESALMKDGEVMYANACKKDNCKSLKILLVLDELTNNLNVYVFNNSKIKTYEESHIIGLTETIGAQYEKLRDEQNSK